MRFIEENMLGRRLLAETAMILRERPRHNKTIKIGLRADGTIYEMGFVRNMR